jgi:hypothetical protein
MKYIGKYLSVEILSTHECMCNILPIIIFLVAIVISVLLLLAIVFSVLLLLAIVFSVLLLLAIAFSAWVESISTLRYFPIYFILNHLFSTHSHVVIPCLIFMKFSTLSPKINIVSSSYNFHNI